MQLPDLGDDLVEEIAVVADDDHRHRLPRQVALEPFGGRDIEMVGGLVQEHQVGALEQEPGEHHPRLLAARERAGRPVEVRFGEAAARRGPPRRGDRSSRRPGDSSCSWSSSYRRLARSRSASSSASAISWAASSSSCCRSSSEASPDWATSISVSSGPNSGCWRSRLTRMPGRTWRVTVIGLSRSRRAAS